MKKHTIIDEIEDFLARKGFRILTKHEDKEEVEEIQVMFIKEDEVIGVTSYDLSNKELKDAKRSLRRRR